MPYVTSAERIGIKKGLQQGQIVIVMRQINRKFTNLDSSITGKIENLNSK